MVAMAVMTGIGGVIQCVLTGALPVGWGWRPQKAVAEEGLGVRFSVLAACARNLAGS
jgi:uncharacterized membrane protein YeiH